MVRKSRCWVFTNFNLDFDYSNVFSQLILSSPIAKKVRYIAVTKGTEECPTTGRKHKHGWVYFNEQICSLKRVSHMLGGVWCETMKGSLQSNDRYASKDTAGELDEWGIRPAQGDRNDLKDVVERIKRGETTADDVCMEDPGYFHMYGRTLQKAEDIALRKRFRTKMTKGIWYCGPTGVGKSHLAFKDFDPDTTYVKPLEDIWWDGYTGQKTVILNDFRGQIRYSELLCLVDKWPHSVKRRGREPAPFLAERVVVTSSLPPEKVYEGVLDRDDNINQLLRRFEVVNLKKRTIAQKCSEGNNGPSEQKIISGETPDPNPSGCPELNAGL